MKEYLKKCGKCKVKLPSSMFYRRTASRDGLASKCKPCCKIYSAEHRKTHGEQLKISDHDKYVRNKPRVLAQTAKWALDNPKKAKAAKVKFYMNNRTLCIKRASNRYEENKEECLYAARQWALKFPVKVLKAKKLWKLNNPGKVIADKAKRRSIQLKATPIWADFEAIEKVYTDSVNRSRTTGIAHHVDHVVPLRGKTVCGLHVHYNLQILTKEDNMKKGNKFIQDMALAA